jgi:SAM-dependent methyltransferase
MDDSATTSFVCRVCGDTQSALACVASDVNRGIDAAQFRYLRCLRCDSLLLESVPDDIGRYYGNDYYPLPATAEELVQRSKYEHYKVDILRRHLPAGRILEIGPGTGGFAYLAKRAGYEVSVIELDERCRQFISNTLSIEVLAASEMLEEQTVGRYDAIVMWHVIEHLPETSRLLDNVSAHLNPDGLLVVALPNPAYIQHRLFGKYWVHLDAPRHVNHIPEATLKSQLEQRGFEVQWRSYGDKGTRFWNRFGWIYSSRNLPAGRFIGPLVRLWGWGMACVSYVLGAIDPTRSAYTLVARIKDPC